MGITRPINRFTLLTANGERALQRTNNQRRGFNSLPWSSDEAIDSLVVRLPELSEEEFHALTNGMSQEQEEDDELLEMIQQRSQQLNDEFKFEVAESLGGIRSRKEEMSKFLSRLPKTRQLRALEIAIETLEPDDQHLRSLKNPTQQWKQDLKEHRCKLERLEEFNLHEHYPEGIARHGDVIVEALEILERAHDIMRFSLFDGDRPYNQQHPKEQKEAPLDDDFFASL
ncbi:expressed unknown protein [Seminavis robusta]|uniref:Uncharacterized protein n=1 Tax=Seminavis robusta TaxID=568900 RepID=A0A9N8HS52_9STRA|nr:expressed unknown protein [Seminavis robusta]|eukprot:Sro1398_g269210.1 n/a (228) ;mRNA; f:1761-2444